MKKIIIALSASTLILAACKEQFPSGLQLSGGGVQFGDTSYIVTSVPAAQLKNILVEEFTAVRCANCPEATHSLKLIGQANPGRLFLAKLHTGSLGTPKEQGDPDLRNQDAIDIDNLLGGSAQGQPAACIDRLPNTATGAFSFVYTSGKWPTLIAQQLALPSIINLKLAAELSGENVKATCDFTLTDTTSKELSYNLYLIEDGIKAAQDSVYLLNGQVTNASLKDYKHDGLFRKSITPPVIGTNLLHPDGNTLQERGRTYRRIVNFSKPSYVANLNNCHLILFVQNRVTKEVIQVTGVEL